MNVGGGCNLEGDKLIDGIPESLDMLRSLVSVEVADIASMVISKSLKVEIP